MHHQDESWAEIGAKVGQRNLSVTADRYTHVLIDYREVDRATLLGRARTVPPRRSETLVSRDVRAQYCPPHETSANAEVSSS